MLADMVQLEEGDLLAKGRTRACYRHPESPDKCIKIFHKKVREKKNHKKEIRETRRLLKKDLRSLVIPRFHGNVETNRGTGFVFDLVQRKTGSAPTLRDWIKEHREDVPRMKEQLYAILLESTAVFSDPHSDNLLVLEDGEEMKFAMIDGLGEKSFLKMRSSIPPLGRKRFKRQWTGFAEEIDTLAVEQGESTVSVVENG